MLVPGRRRPASDERGAAAVEFALVLPVLAMLVFGVISFAVIFAQQLSLGNAARQGARFGVVGNRTCAEIMAETKQASETIALGAAQVTVLVERGSTAGTAGSICPSPAATNKPCEDSTPGDNIYVTAKFEGELVIPLAVYDPTFPLSGKGVFRCEYS